MIIPAGSLSLLLLLLTPEADLHHKAAVAAYAAGDLQAAESELHAAYAALPDPERDREKREEMLIELRGVLLAIHSETGAPAPLCRLRDALRAHVETLPQGTPPSLEVTRARARLVEVMGKLTAFPADACEPQPPPPAAAPAPTTAPAPVRAATLSIPPVTDPGPTARQLRITGGVLGGLGLGLLGVMTYAVVDNQRQGARSRAIDADIGDRPVTPDELAALQDHRARAQSSQVLAIGTGISSAVLSISSIAIFVGARRAEMKANKTTARRIPIVTPWHLPAGGGLTLRWALH